ncbi:MAG: hypothetical protein R2744_02940 [Bacteroidales bacterium]
MNSGSVFFLPVVILISVAGVAGTLPFTYNGLAITFPLLAAVLPGLYMTIEVAARIVTEIAFAFTRERSFNINYKLVCSTPSPPSWLQ